MMHKVSCMDCGRTERIEVHYGQPIKSGWAYYGKLNINVCQTSKYFLKPKDQKNLLGECEKIPNRCYDPKVKPKYAELWSCPKCMAQLEKEGSLGSKEKEGDEK